MLTTIGLKESLGMWRDDLLKQLQIRGTARAVQELRRIASEIPEQEESLKWTIYTAETETRWKTWSAPEPQDVLTLASGEAKRLIQNGDQIGSVCCDLGDHRNQRLLEFRVEYSDEESASRPLFGRER